MFKSVTSKVNECFPEKTLKFTSDDSPWVNEKVKKLKRLKGGEFNKHRSSNKWFNLNEKYKKVLSLAHINYYKNIVKDLKLSNPFQWYLKLKGICSYDQDIYEKIDCSEIEHLTDEEQADKIAEYFCTVRQKFEPVNPSEIRNELFSQDSIPQFT